MHSELYVPFITPSGVPGVLYKPVLQTSGFISAVADNKHTMVDIVKEVVFSVFVRAPAIDRIDDSTSVLMYVFIVSCNSGDNRLFLKAFLKRFYSIDDRHTPHTS